MDCQLSSLASFLPSRKGCKYAKIPLTNKIRLFKAVMQQGIPIRRISEKLGIKYSTAKTLVRQYKDWQIDIDLTIVENETNAISSKRQKHLRAEYRQLCPVGLQNLVKDDEATEMNVTAIISHRETADCHGVPHAKTLGRVEIVSKIISRC